MSSTTNKTLHYWSLVAVLMLVSATLNSPLQAQDIAVSTPVAFSQQTTPNNGINNFLFAISGDADNDVWAVGTTAPGAIALHFNGTAWSAVPMALPSADDMRGVSVLAPNDVWAVGNALDTATQHTTSVIQHFNGKKWSLVASPHFASGDQLFAVKAIASNDVFAVGEFNSDVFNCLQFCGPKPQPLIEHFDGTKWTVIPTPALKAGQTQSLKHVAATSHNDVWVTGVDEPPFQAAIMHFDGQKFRNVPFPSLSRVDLEQIAAISANDAWVVGDIVTATTTGTTVSTLTAHWNGKIWTIVPSPNATNADALGEVSARSSTDVWAVGCSMSCGADSGAGTILVEHFDGTRWAINPVPQIGTMGDVAFGILALSSGDIFVAGVESSPPDFADTLVLHGKEGWWRPGE